MKTTLRLLAFITLMLVIGGGNVGAETTVTFTAGTDKGDKSVTKDGITLSASNGNFNGKSYYAVYSGGKLTVSSTAGHIKQVVFTFSQGNFFSPSSGTYKGRTWTGDAASFTLEVSGTRSVNMTKVVVTLDGTSKTATTLAFDDPADKAFTIHATKGTTFTNKATLTPAVDGAVISYASSNGSVASVTQDGTVTVTTSAVGSATITASYAGNDAYEGSTASYQVSVGKAAATVGFENASYTFVMDSEEAKAFAGQTATVTPTNATVTYASSNESLAPVDAETGRVTLATGTEGTATITASVAETDDHTASSASYTITVKGPNPETASSDYDFSTEEGIRALGIVPPSRNNTGNSLDEGEAYRNGVVSMEVTEAQVYKTSAKEYDLRVYKGESVTFSVPTGYSLKSVSFTGDSHFTDWETEDQNVSTKTFKASKAMRIKTITVTYNMGTPAEMTLSDQQETNTLAEGLADVTLTRSFTADAWNSLVLPFDLSASELADVFGAETQVAELQGVSTKDDDTYTLNFGTTTAGIKANMPVLVYGAGDVSEKRLEKVNVMREDPTFTPKYSKQYFSFVGTYDKVRVHANDWFISGNNFYRAIGTERLKPMRALFRPLTDESAAKGLMFSVDGSTPSGIDGVGFRTKTGEEGAPVFNLAGQRVGKGYRGIVVQDGHKMLRR